MQSKTARPMRRSVNLANLGLLEFRLARGMGAGQKNYVTEEQVEECHLRGIEVRPHLLSLKVLWWPVAVKEFGLE
jgi:hypothetical protein